MIMKIVGWLAAAVVVGFLLALVFRALVGATVVTPTPLVNLSERSDKPCRCGEREG